MTWKASSYLPTLAPFVLASLLCALPLEAQAHRALIEAPEVGIYLGEGFANTQLPAYADNATGGTGGAYVQPNQWLGAEIRGSSFPVSAEFTQSPIVVGVRTAPRLLKHYNGFGFLGGGMSYARDSGATWRTKLPSTFVPAWQASIGVDRRFSQVSWRILEVSYIDAYTPTHTLRTLTAGTGIVIRFRAD